MSDTARAVVVGGALAGMAGMAGGAEFALRVFGQNVAAFDSSVALGLLLGALAGAGLGFAVHALDSRSRADQGDRSPAR